MQIPPELFTTFNNVKFYDEEHRYFVNKKELTSVTTVIGKYEEEFDEIYWSNVKAESYGLTSNQVRYAWDFINLYGTTRGSVFHDYAEALFLNKIFQYPENNVKVEFGYDPIRPGYEQILKQLFSFYRKTKNRLIPIRTEFIMYDLEYMIAGMLDMLFYNVKQQVFQIWDWKTNKELSFSSKDNLKGPLYLLDGSDHDKYSLQLHSYKYILEKNVPIKIDGCFMVWFNEVNDNYKVIEALDYANQIEPLYKHYRKNDI